MKPLQVPFQTADKTALDRSRWHKPLVSIVVTHHNYSHHVCDALLSVLDQTYDNWECVVVDDASTEDHGDAVERIVETIGSPRIRLLKLAQNVGQMRCAFAGLDDTSGEFVCVLDPDDRYAPTFLEEAVAGHLNDTVYCPVLSTDQYFMANGSVIAGTFTHQRLHFVDNERGISVIPDQPKARLLYYSSGWGGWHWGSTSSLMFRRGALELMRPPASKTRNEAWAGGPGYPAVDSYLAQGAHRMGGTLFLTRSLVYRAVHPDNAYLINRVISLSHQESKYDGPENSRRCLELALAAIKANGGEALLHQAKAQRRRRGLFARLGRSFAKRWRRWTAR